MKTLLAAVFTIVLTASMLGQLPPPKPTPEPPKTCPPDCGGPNPGINKKAYVKTANGKRGHKGTKKGGTNEKASPPPSSEKVAK